MHSVSITFVQYFCVNYEMFLISELANYMYLILSIILMLLSLFQISYELNFMTSKPGPGVYTINIRSDYVSIPHLL